MATTSVTQAFAEGEDAVRLSPVARWVPIVDDGGRRRVVMEWAVPDADEALRALLRECR